MSGDVEALESEQPSASREAHNRLWIWLNACVAVAALGTLASASGAGGSVTLALVLAPVWLALAAVWVGLAIAWLSRPTGLPQLLAAPIVVLATVLLLTVHAPVRVRFELSRPAFDSAASTAPAATDPGQTFPVHHRVGLFLISYGQSDRPGSGQRCVGFTESGRFAVGAGGEFVLVPQGVDPAPCAGQDAIDLGGGWYTRAFDGF